MKLHPLHPISPRISILAALCLLPAAPLAAQHALYVEHGESMRLVRKVVELKPYVENEGQLIPASGSRYLMKKVDEFVPLSVTVNDVKASFSSAESADSASALNKNFHFQASFESAYGIENVFVVLDLKSEKMGKILFLREVGRLAPGQPRFLSVSVPLADEFGEGHYTLRLFVDGQEIFHSKMPFALVEQTIDLMVAKRIAGKVDAMPAPYIRPAPVYPEALRKANTAGKALIRFTISATGRVRDPEVSTASDPAFGEAALTAIRLWRFLPRVKDGQPVEMKTELPFSFSPPAP